MGNGVTNGAVTELLADLSQRGIRLDAGGDQLAYFPRAKVTPELRDRLRQHKKEILDLLRGPAYRTALPDTVPASLPEPAVSVVILESQPHTLESCSLSALGQTHAPREILVLGVRRNRRMQKTVAAFASHGVRCAATPLDASGEFIVLGDGRTLLTREWIAKGLEQLADRSVGVAYSDHELLSPLGGWTQYPDRLTADDLARSGRESPTVLMRRDVLVEAWRPGESVSTLMRQLARTGWQLKKQSATVLFRGGKHELYYEQQGLASETVTLFIPLSGREHTWRELRRFLDRQT